MPHPPAPSYYPRKLSYRPPLSSSHPPPKRQRPCQYCLAKASGFCKKITKTPKRKGYGYWDIATGALTALCHAPRVCRIISMGLIQLAKVSSVISQRHQTGGELRKAARKVFKSSFANPGIRGIAPTPDGSTNAAASVAAGRVLSFG